MGVYVIAKAVDMLWGGVCLRVYIARQPIFNICGEVIAYELLYRESEFNGYSGNVGGSQATMAVMSDTSDIFGVKKIINDKCAFINFNRESLLNGAPYMMHSDEIVVEILEDVEPNQEIVDCVKKLKEKGYEIAIDDYIGGDEYEQLLPFIDIVKVDFSLLDFGQREVVAKKLKKKNVSILAEKVETEADYVHAKKHGYDLYQGYYFAKPTVLSKKSAEVAKGTSARVLKGIGEDVPDYDQLAEIIRNDVALTYRLMAHVNTVHYQRRERVASVKDALVRMGTEKVRRWFSMVLARELMGDSEIMVLANTALVRALFCERLAGRIGVCDLADAFTTGMFSLIHLILDDEVEELLENLCISENCKQALLGEKNDLRVILDYIIMYEKGELDLEPSLFGKKVSADELIKFYWEATKYADDVLA